MAFVPDAPSKFVPDGDSHSPAEPPPAAEEDPTSARNLAGAATEPMLSMASSAVAQPVAGLAGIGAMAGHALGLTDKDPADVVRDVQDKLTYAPRTTGGKNAMSAFSAPFEELAKGADWAGEQIDDGTPAGHARAALLNAAIQTVPQILIGHGLAKVGDFTPSTPSPEVSLLADKGVTMTPGQIKGGALGRIEQGAQSIPIIGDFIRNARASSVEQFGNATLNDALGHIGEELPPEAKGHAAVADANDKFDDAYTAILPQLKGDLYNSSTPTMPPLIADITQLKQMAQSLPDQQRADFNRIIDDEVVGKFTPAGLASGDTLKDIRETLNGEISDFKSGGPYERKLANALTETKSAIDRMVTDQNPQYADDLQNLNLGYAKFKIAQRAATTAGKDGVFTPNQYLQAVKNSGSKVSKDNARYAKGEALQQPLAAAGASVLGNSLPDSGTAYRWYLERAALGGGAAGAAALSHPAIGAALATVPAIYSQFGLKALQPALLGKTPAVGEAVGAGLPVGAAEDADKTLEQQAGHAKGGVINEPDYRSELALMRHW